MSSDAHPASIVEVSSNSNSVSSNSSNIHPAFVTPSIVAVLPAVIASSQIPDDSLLPDDSPAPVAVISSSKPHKHCNKHHKHAAAAPAIAPEQVVAISSHAGIDGIQQQPSNNAAPAVADDGWTTTLLTGKTTTAEQHFPLLLRALCHSFLPSLTAELLVLLLHACVQVLDTLWPLWLRLHLDLSRDWVHSSRQQVLRGLIDTQRMQQQQQQLLQKTVATTCT